MKLRLIYTSLLFAIVGCAAPAQNLVISLQDVSCQSWGVMSVEAIRAAKGVETATFDKIKVELNIRYSPKLQTPESLRTIVNGLGYAAEIGAGQGYYQPVKTRDELGDVITFSKPDAQLDIEAMAVENKVTIVDFFAVWCGPCRQVDEHIRQLMSEKPAIAYRRIDIGDWDSGVAKRYLGQVPELPFLVIYGRNRRELGRIAGLNLRRLDELLNQALRP